jgi:plastocyanin
VATATVNVNDPMSFDPSTVNIKAGDTVKWVWTGSIGHSTTADDDSWDSGVHNGPYTFNQTFPTAGTYPYYCSVHGAPGGVGMSGTVVVS